MSAYKIFISSPGDVGRERHLAEQVIRRVAAEFKDRVEVQPYFWEYEPMEWTRDYQENIPLTSEFDLVICILWKRLGSPLSVKHERPGGGRWRSGTFRPAKGGERSQRSIASIAGLREKTYSWTPDSSGLPFPPMLAGDLKFCVNRRMPLCSIAVGRIVTEDQEYHSYGGFVIDTSLNRQDEILNLLSAGHMRRIGVELGVIPGLGYAMPPNMLYELSAFALSPIELPATPIFRSEGGHKIWIRGGFNIQYL
jgi:hypothetical protein